MVMQTLLRRRVAGKTVDEASEVIDLRDGPDPAAPLGLVDRLVDEIDLREPSPTPPSPGPDIARPLHLYLLAQRATDLAVAVPALLMAAPVLVGVALAVALSSRGPVLYRHAPLVRHWHSFLCLKFRSMHVDADQRLEHLLATNPERREEWAIHHKLTDDPRITSIGAWLRRTSIDELPQLWNVIRGDMSLVGPRPITSSETDRYGHALETVLQVKPGITGPWQVAGRNDISYDERVVIDLRYASAPSLRTNLQVLAKTGAVVLSGRGAR